MGVEASTCFLVARPTGSVRVLGGESMKRDDWPDGLGDSAPAAKTLLFLLLDQVMASGGSRSQVSAKAARWVAVVLHATAKETFHFVRRNLHEQLAQQEVEAFLLSVRALLVSRRCDGATDFGHSRVVRSLFAANVFASGRDGH